MLRHALQGLRLPREQGQWPVLVATLLQCVAALAIIVIVRDLRPDPADEPEAFMDVGPVYEFWAIFGPMALLAFLGMTGLYALPDMAPAQRADQCSLLMRVLAAATPAVALMLLYFGRATGCWLLFAPLTLVMLGHLLLTYLALRYLGHQQPHPIAAARW